MTKHFALHLPSKYHPPGPEEMAELAPAMQAGGPQFGSPVQSTQKPGVADVLSSQILRAGRRQVNPGGH